MKHKNEFPMTQAGKNKLTEELAYLTSEKREEVKDRIKAARTFCDFNEDSEFEASLQEQEIVEDRIKTLQYMIQHATIIQPADPGNDTISIGRTVTFTELGSDEEETYTIVGLAEADPLAGKISDQSPLAQSLLGKKVNDEISLTIPDGQIKVRITDVE